MFVSKFLLALLLLCTISTISAHPMPLGVQHHHVRARGASTGRVCKPRPSASASLSSTINVSETKTATPSVSTLAATSASATSSTHESTTTTTATVSSSSHASSSSQPSSSSDVTHSSSHSTAHSSPSASPSASSSTPHSSASASSSATAEPTKVPSAGSSSRAFAALAPVDPITSWSTSPSAPDPLPLDDSTFHLTHLLSDLAHPYVTAPDGELSMEATYPKGSYNFDNEPRGGLSFYAFGPDDVDLTTAKEVTFGYSVYFEDGFDWAKGGKLPGFFGGDSDEEAFSCSGGRRDDGCWSSRIMWREDGKGELYTYLPPDADANKAVCDVAPESLCNQDFGASVGRGAFYFKAGQSNAVTMRVRLNDAGKENGELELWANGESVINVGGLVLRESDAGRIRGLMVQTFFGGNTPDYASPKDQHTWFRDFTVAITEKL